MGRGKILALLVILALTAVATTYVFQHFAQGEINYAKGMRLFNARLHESAIPYFEKAHDLRPNDIGVLRHLALSSLWAGEFDKASKAFNQLLQKNPKDRTAIRGLVDIQARTGQLDDAILLYEAMLRKDPKDPETRLSLAYALYWKGNFKDAIPLFNVYLKKDPTHQESNAFLTDSLFKDGHEDEANAIITDLSLKFPKNTNATNAVAKYYLINKNYDKAIEQYKKTLALDRRNIEATIMLANCLIEKNDLQAAAVTLQDALCFFPGVYEIHAKLDEIVRKLQTGVKLPMQNCKDTK